MSLMPLVSIGMPVYNCETYLAQALDSLLAQSYPNFELIVSDNGSGDRTWEICEEFAARNPQMHIYRNDRNYGPVYNFERVLQLAKGNYFLWAAHDDLWDKDYIAECMKLLVANDDAVLAYTLEERFIVRTGQRILVNHNLDLGQRGYKERVAQLLKRKSLPHSVIYGVMRRDSALQALPIKEVLDADLLFLLEIAQHGKILGIKSLLRYSNIKTKSVHDRLQEIGVFNRYNTQYVLLKMHWQMLRCFLRIVTQPSLKFLDKLYMAIYVIEWAIRHAVWSYKELWFPK